MLPAGKSRKMWIGVVAPALLAGTSWVSPPRPALCSKTVLYLLAQYKAAMGDSRSAIELLNRAAEPDASKPSAERKSDPPASSCPRDFHAVNTAAASRVTICKRT